MTFDALIDGLKKSGHVFLQTHNYPDHDAVASAFSFQYLLSTLGIKSSIVYDGDIQRDSLSQMIEELGIDIHRHTDYEMTEKDKVIIIDGCKWNKNVTDLIGDEVGVIDHHQVEKPEDVSFADIRPWYGACSTILYEYFLTCRVEIPKPIATALMIGINMDTALLTRGVCLKDIEAYANLYRLSDIQLQNKILRNYIQTKDLSFYRYAIDHVKISAGVAFCFFPDGCNQNLLAILGDFFLALEEVEFAILCAKNGDRINLSVRSERKEWDAARIIRTALENTGFGGGHPDMAGGIVYDSASFDPGEILNKFKSLLV